MITISIFALNVLMAFALEASVKNTNDIRITKGLIHKTLAGNVFNLTEIVSESIKQKQTNYDFNLRRVINNATMTNTEIANIIALAKKGTEIVKEKAINPEEVNRVKSVKLVDVNLLRKILFLNYMHRKGAMLYNLGKPVIHDIVDTLYKMKLGSQYPKVAFEILDGQSLLEMLSLHIPFAKVISPSAVKPMSKSDPQTLYYKEKSENISECIDCAASNRPAFTILDTVTSKNPSEQEFSNYITRVSGDSKTQINTIISMDGSNLHFMTLQYTTSFKIEPSTTFANIEVNSGMSLFPSQTIIPPLTNDYTIDMANSNSLFVSSTEVEISYQSIAPTFTVSKTHTNIASTMTDLETSVHPDAVLDYYRLDVNNDLITRHGIGMIKAGGKGFKILHSSSSFDVTSDILSTVVQSSLSHSFPTIIPIIEDFQPLLINVSSDAGLSPENNEHFNIQDSIQSSNTRDILLRTRRNLLFVESTNQLSTHMDNMEAKLYSQKTVTSPNHIFETYTNAFDTSSLYTPITFSIISTAPRLSTSSTHTHNITFSTAINTTRPTIEYTFTNTSYVYSSDIPTGAEVRSSTVIKRPTRTLVSQETLTLMERTPSTSTTTTARSTTTTPRSTTTTARSTTTTARPINTMDKPTTVSPIFSWCNVVPRLAVDILLVGTNNTEETRNSS